MKNMPTTTISSTPPKDPQKKPNLVGYAGRVLTSTAVVVVNYPLSERYNRAQLKNSSKESLKFSWTKSCIPPYGRMPSGIFQHIMRGPGVTLHSKIAADKLKKDFQIPIIIGLPIIAGPAFAVVGLSPHINTAGKFLSLALAEGSRNAVKIGAIDPIKKKLPDDLDTAPKELAAILLSSAGSKHFNDIAVSIRNGMALQEAMKHCLNPKVYFSGFPSKTGQIALSAGGIYFGQNYVAPYLEKKFS